MHLSNYAVQFFLTKKLLHKKSFCNPTTAANTVVMEIHNPGDFHEKVVVRGSWLVKTVVACMPPPLGGFHIKHCVAFNPVWNHC
jgi:hypothetical protein